MNVLLGSMFRDSKGYLPRYFAQVDSLRTALEARGDRLRVVLVENDSTDDTWEALDHWLFGHFADGVLIRAHDDCPYFDSEDRPERWRHHAWVINHVFDEVAPTDDVVVYIESDLIWTADALVRLIDHKVDVASPMVVRGGIYYDTWGSRKGGVKFSHFPPFHPDLAEGLNEMDSVASCLVMRGDVARSARFPETAHVGFCETIRGQGHHIFLDTTVEVFHP